MVLPEEPFDDEDVDVDVDVDELDDEPESLPAAGLLAEVPLPGSEPDERESVR
ncbi:hypothetical protein AB0873_25235 [Micromonospora sp. NPDC047707]|uniref:hypothetical protein n=1 Tax=Micromonospora sp. NPDC047707 TaxID=3154498 RepID=UPI003455529A